MELQIFNHDIVKPEGQYSVSSSDSCRIPYMPYGVTTIEMGLSGEEIKEGYLFPMKRVTKEKKYFGYSDSSEDYLIIWGGGIREGIKTIIENEPKRFFLQFVHIGPLIKTPTLTLFHTVDPFTPLKKLEMIPADRHVELTRMRIRTTGNDTTTENVAIAMTGNRIPFYYPRWFPPRPPKDSIQYCELDLPKIELRFRANISEDVLNRNIASDVFITLDGKKICQISGDLKHSNLHAEIFTMFRDNSMIVLRVWFYWIHENLDKNPVLGGESFLEAIQMKSQFDQKPVTPGRNFLKSLDIEVPDIERLDFLIDTKKRKIIFVGTDFHYQEMWYLIDEDREFVEARIANQFDASYQIIQRAGFRLKHFDQSFNPVDKLRKILDGSNKEIDLFDPRTSDRNQSSYDFGESNRRLGVFRKHIPFANNGSILTELVSSIVTS